MSMDNGDLQELLQLVYKDIKEKLAFKELKE
jgi:hypothetical protein